VALNILFCEVGGISHAFISDASAVVPSDPVSSLAFMTPICRYPTITRTTLFPLPLVTNEDKSRRGERQQGCVYVSAVSEVGCYSSLQQVFLNCNRIIRSGHCGKEPSLLQQQCSFFIGGVATKVFVFYICLGLLPSFRNKFFLR
jgi:hypothetical protein